MLSVVLASAHGYKVENENTQIVGPALIHTATVVLFKVCCNNSP